MRYLGQDQTVESTLQTLDVQGLDSSITVLDLPAAEVKAPLNSIVVGKDLPPNQLMNLFVNQGVRHVVQMPNKNFSRQVAFTAQVMTTPKEFFENPRQFFLQNGNHSLIGSPSQLFEYLTKDHPDKEGILEILRRDIKTVPKMNTVRDPALMAADEMLMNIYKDAPHYFKKEYPEASFAGRSSKLCLAHDGEYLLLWTEDDFGSLSVEKLLKRLQACYSEEQIAPIMDENATGAGLGCRTIIDLSVSVSVFVKPGVKTIFSALLPIGLSYRQQQGLPKNFQVFAMQF